MNQPEESRPPWWRRGVVYQVYVRSFADSTGDGTGDVNGLRSRLDYLRDLGVDALWVTPWYQSPLADGGYDVADYRVIDPRYGTVADVEALVAESHERHIRVIADIVPNHTSDQHAWFREAVAAPPGDPARLRYHIRDGRGPHGAEPPTNWTSVFGGPAWTRLPDGQWYLHLFAREQPDLNWDNAEVRAEFESILRFWLDRGIDGFRVDVAHGLAKDTTFPDVENDGGRILGSSKQPNHPHWDRDGIHEIVRSWRAVVDEYDDRMLVAEAWVRPERLPLYLAPDEYHQSFNFGFLEAPWSAELRTVIEESVKAAASVDSTPTWVLSNHDVMRETTRYGLPSTIDWRTWPLEGPAEALDEEQGRRRARAACLLMLALPGSAYIYQGEELGLPEVWDLPPDALDDPVWARSNHTQKGRDGCRVPLPWDRSQPSCGFGTGRSWLPQPPGWSDHSVGAQRGRPDSMLELYRAALTIRRELGVHDEEIELMPSTETSIVYRRASGLRCLVNFVPGDVELPPHDEVLLASDALPGPTLLGPDSAVWLR
jgi:alpha-glucosidase